MFFFSSGARIVLVMALCSRRCVSGNLELIQLQYPRRDPYGQMGILIGGWWLDKSLQHLVRRVKMFTAPKNGVEFRP